MLSLVSALAGFVLSWSNVLDRSRNSVDALLWRLKFAVKVLILCVGGVHQRRMAGLKESEVWVVLHCEKDDSHVLVTQDAVLYDGDALDVNDLVRFEYPGEKDLLEGVVKGRSGKFTVRKAVSEV